MFGLLFNFKLSIEILKCNVFNSSLEQLEHTPFSGPLNNLYDSLINLLNSQNMMKIDENID